MWLLLGPVLEPLEDSVVALNDPVLVDGCLLHFGGRDGHAKAHLQDPAPYTHKGLGLGGCPEAGAGAATRHRETCYQDGRAQRALALSGNSVGPGQQPGRVASQGGPAPRDFEPGSSGVHRGWYLLTWLLSSPPPTLPT